MRSQTAPSRAPEPTTSAAWATALAMHGKALIPADTSPQAFDAAAEAYHRGGPAEHNFTMASLALARMAQAEEHQATLTHALALLRAAVRKLDATLTSSATQTGRGLAATIKRLDAILAVGDGLSEAMERFDGGEGGGGEPEDEPEGPPSRGGRGPSSAEGDEPSGDDGGTIGLDGDEEVELVDVGGAR